MSAETGEDLPAISATHHTMMNECSIIPSTDGQTANYPPHPKSIQKWHSVHLLAHWVRH